MAEMEIDSKLDMSLDDLISKSSRPRTSESKGVHTGRSGKRGHAPAKVPGGRKTGRKDSDDSDAMNIDAPKKGGKNLVNKSPLGVSRSGINKKGAGRMQGRRSDAMHLAVTEHVTPKGNINGVWSHDLHMDDGPSAPRRVPGLDNTRRKAVGQRQVLRKLVISNLNAKVDEQDLHELFGRIGDLDTAELIQVGDTRTNRKSTAEVVFRAEGDAKEAKAKYDGVALDGDPMRIEIRGVADVERVLQSGLRVTRPAGTGPRGRGAQGRLRSD